MSGEPLALKDVVKLHFAKGPEGGYMCPVLNKVFTESTHIVAVRPTGNVYCWEVRAHLHANLKTSHVSALRQPVDTADVCIMARKHWL